MSSDVMIRSAGGLLLVILAIFFCAWLTKRAGLSLRPPGRAIQQVDRINLGARQSVTVIQVAQTWLVIGATPTALTLLHSQPASSDEVELTPSSPPPGGRGFAAWLNAAGNQPKS